MIYNVLVSSSLRQSKFELRVIYNWIDCGEYECSEDKEQV